MTRSVLLVDGLNLFVRSFVVNPTMDVNGEHVGGFIGFMQALCKILRENSPTDVIVAWDGEGGSVKRRSLFKDYKAGRKPKVNRQYDFDQDAGENIKSFSKQLELIDKYLPLLPVKSIRVEGVEADDVIAYMCVHMIPKTFGKLIVSSDRDFYQLLDNRTIIYSPTKKVYFKSADLDKEFGILPENFIMMKALIGDGSDNIAGLKGIGKKTVTKLFPFLKDSPSDLEDIFRYAENNKDENQKYKLVLESREILNTNVSLMQLTSPLMGPLASKAIREKLKENVSLSSLDFKTNLIRDGMQINTGDFFLVFKDQLNRTLKVYEQDNADDVEQRYQEQIDEDRVAYTLVRED